VAAGDESAGIFSKWVWNFIWFGSLLVIWYFFWRRNPLSYLLGPLAAFCFLRVWSFWKMTGSVYRVHAWITVIAVLLVFALLMLEGRREERA
jgi:lipopolysaccharide export LptBFGC system permease protein LptF